MQKKSLVQSASLSSCLEPDILVGMSQQEGKPIVAPVQLVYMLEGLLAQITDQNLHSEQEIGPAIGNEEWR